jgi:hypothetical protein
MGILKTLQMLIYTFVETRNTQKNAKYFSYRCQWNNGKVNI